MLHNSIQFLWESVKPQRHRHLRPVSPDSSAVISSSPAEHCTLTMWCPRSTTTMRFTMCVLSDIDQGPWSHYRTTAQQWGCSSHRSLRGDPYPTVSFAQYRRPHGTHVVSTRTAACWQDIPICPDRKLQITKMAARERQIVQRSVELPMNFHNLWLSSNPGWIRECRFWTHYRKKAVSRSNIIDRIYMQYIRG